MDNKIKELAHQSKLLDDDGWNTTNLNISVDKFAELLIREVCDVVKDEIHFELGGYGTAEEVCQSVRQYFGIK